MPIQNPCEECDPIEEVVLPDPCDTACLETVKASCVVYQDDALDCLYNTGEATSLRLNVILGRMAEFMCQIEGDAGSFDVSCLNPTQVTELTTVSSMQFLIDYLCAREVTVRSSDCSIAVTDSSINNNNIIYELAINFGDTTYEEDLTLTQPVEVEVIKDGNSVDGTNCGDYHLNVKTNFSTTSVTQEFSSITPLGSDNRYGTVFTVAYNQPGIGSVGTAPIANQAVKTGVNVSLNSGFVLGLDATLPNHGSIPGAGSGYILPIYQSADYVVLATIDDPSFIPLRGQLYHCKFKLTDDLTGIGHNLYIDPNVVPSSGTASYQRYSFDGVILAAPVGVAYTELRFYSMENFNIAIPPGTAIRIFSGSALSYNIV